MGLTTSVFRLILLGAVGLSAACSNSTGDGPSPKPAFDPSLLPGIVARVNGVELTREQLMARLQSEAKDGDAILDFEQVQETLEELINAELLFQDASARGFALDENELEQRMATIQARFPDQESFLAVLAEQGLNPAGMKRNLGRDLAVSRYLDQTIVSEVAITEEEARHYFDENKDQIRGDDQLKVRHILIQLEDDVSEEALRKAYFQLNDIRNQILNGADFSEMARRYSEDPGSAALGGELDWISRGTTVPSFEEAAYRLREGQLSPVIRSRFGLHIIQVTGRRPGPPVSYEQAKEKLLDYLKEKEIAERIGQRAAELRKEADVEVYLPANAST